MLNKLKEVLAKNLSRIRVAKGFTQESLASASDMSQRMIQKIEHQLSWPSPETMEKLAAVLKVDPCDFYAVNSKAKSSFRDAILRFTTLEDSQMSTVLRYIESLTLSSESHEKYVEKVLADTAPPTQKAPRKPG